jgi:lipid-A-disaccharide synthase
MKYYLISGEASGDLHGSNLIREIRKLDPDAQIRCWGGDMMQAAGAELVMHYKERAYMGFLEVALNIRKIIKNLKFCKEDLEAFAPDAVIFIDYPGFNIPVAQFAHKKGFRTIYYISPQVWAWKESRVKTLKEVIDKMLVILPFEKAFYHKWKYEVEYVGHPLVQVVDEFKISHAELVKPSEINIALLPGSRMQEINIKLPIMLEVSRYFPSCKFSVAQAPSLDDSFYAPMVKGYPNVQLVKEKTYELLMQSHAALVTSGTATLETALFGVPEVVCYKGSRISYEIAKRLIKVPYISLVNLILDKPAVKELIQEDLTPENIKSELDKLLYNRVHRDAVLSNYKALWEILSLEGAASAKAAKLITDFAKQNKHD